MGGTKDVSSLRFIAAGTRESIYFKPCMLSELDAIAGVKMKVLVVCLLAVLGCGLAGAKVMTKCSVKTLVQNAVAQLPVKVQQSGLNDPNLVAKSKYGF